MTLRTLKRSQGHWRGGVLRIRGLPPSQSGLKQTANKESHPPRQRPPLGTARRVHFPLVTAAHVTSTASPALRVFPAADRAPAPRLRTAERAGHPDVGGRVEDPGKLSCWDPDWMDGRISEID